MARKPLYDSNEVRNLYDEGKSWDEIMQITGIKSRSNLNYILKNTGGNKKDKKATMGRRFSFPAITLPADVCDAISGMTDEEITTLIIEAVRAKSPYSQIEGGQEQNSHIAETDVDSCTYDLWITYLDEDKQIIGKETAQMAIPEQADNRDVIIDTIDDVVRTIRQSHCQKARYTTWEFNILSLCHTIGN